MSLKYFHQVIIFAGFATCLIFAAYCFFSPDVAGSTGYWWSGVLSIVASVGFIAYEVHFLKKTRKLILN